MKTTTKHGLARLLSVCLILLVSATLSAQTVTLEEATTVCQRFVQEKFAFTTTPAPSVAAWDVIRNEDGKVGLFRFDLSPRGFVLVSASKAAMPVMAYSFDEVYEEIPPVKDYTTAFAEEIVKANEAKRPALARDAADWERYLADEFAPKASKVPVRSPLLTTRWNQNKFYNTYCPWDEESGPYYDYRVPNGCVALATAQVMNYHRHPISGFGASAYLSPGYGMHSVNFGHQTYHWDAMCNEPLSYANEIAKLVYHVGVSIKMMYGSNGSSSNLSEVKKRLYENFHYDQSITTYERNSFPGELVSEYVDVLKTELDKLHPILYSGHPGTGAAGHAYVVDGYDDNDRFHVNWGWGGSSNAYYAIDNFVAGDHYDVDANALVNVFPSSAQPIEYCQGHKRQTASFGYVADGSPTAKPYQPNPDCSWMIATPGATSYSFTVDRLDLNPDVDYVTIYNGPTTAYGVRTTLTGNQIPQAIYTVNADSVLITFTTTGNATTNTDYYGFLLSYTTALQDFTPCDMFTNVSDWHTIISDGTDAGKDYSPETSCTWNVSLNYISGFAFGFPKFDLGSGDFVDVYDNTSNPPVLYKRFDNNSRPDGSYTVNFRKMRIVFVADNWDQADGFQLEYYALASVDDRNGVQDARVYPNPTSGSLNVSYAVDEPSTVTMNLMDAAGRLLSCKTMSAMSGENTMNWDVSSLSAGLYLLEISTPKGRLIRKVMVE